MSEHTEMSSGLMSPPVGCSAGAGQRMRAHRQRRRAGLRCIVVQIRQTEVTEVIRRKLLEADARYDANAVRTALYRLPR